MTAILLNGARVATAHRPGQEVSVNGVGYGQARGDEMRIEDANLLLPPREIYARNGNIIIDCRKKDEQIH